ncbi:MAG: DUF368 domain-containing protein [Bacteroides sp.]
MKYLLLYCKGFLMGMADLIPGVSGGTIALLVGVYEELVSSISKTIQRENLNLLFQGKVASYFRAIHWDFLVALILGILTAIFSLARLVRYLLHVHTIAVESLFFGLMLATVFVVGAKVSHWDWRAVLLGFVGTAFGLLLNFGTPLSGSDSYLAFFFASMLGICAMILPGISGSFILILLGMYSRVLQLVETLDVTRLAIVSLGAIVGLLSFSKLLHWLFARFERLLLALLAGFILGAMVRLWPWKAQVSDTVAYHLELQLPSTYVANMGEAHLISAVFFFVMGFLLVLGLDNLTRKKRRVRSEVL